jgi:phosphate:Na+ symporter
LCHGGHFENYLKYDLIQTERGRIYELESLSNSHHLGRHCLFYVWNANHQPIAAKTHGQSYPRSYEVYLRKKINGPRNWSAVDGLASKLRSVYIIIGWPLLCRSLVPCRISACNLGYHYWQYPDSSTSEFEHYQVRARRVCVLVFRKISHQSTRVEKGNDCSTWLWHVVFGLELIGTGTAALRELPDFSQPLQTFNDNPLLVIVVTTILTTIVHSSTVTIGFAMALASQGLLTFESSLFWIFGANIGTTGVALIASLGENETGKQVAWAHTLIKVAGVCLFLPFVSYIGSINLGNTPERGIANFHTFYNILSAFILIPALPLLSKAVQILVPNKKGSDQFGTKYLDRYSWSTSSTPMALAHAEREALRMANIVTKMLAESLNLFRDYNPELAEKISGQDDKVDLLNREIRIFLTEKLDWEVDGSAESQADIMRVFTYVSDLESAADVIDNTLKEMAAKKHSLKLEFSDEAWGDLDQLHKKIMLLNDYSLGCFQRRDKQLGAKAISTKRDIRKLEVTFKESHMARLLEGVKESSRSSSIVMDLLGEMRRISGLLTNHIYQEFGSEDRYNILPRKIK